MGMPLELTWKEIALRLLLTVIAGVLIGYDRSEHGKAAGMRTTLLVCLAASVAMIQVNLLLPMAGKSADSFVTNDLMRLPLGILTGVGFIGGGAILKKGDLVTGVTTAATLWVMTVIGLCLGGGQLILGITTTVLAVITLWALRWIDLVIPRAHRAKLTVTCPAQWSVLEDVPKLIRSMQYRARFLEQKPSRDPEKMDYSFELSWNRPERDDPPIDLLQTIDRRFPVRLFELTTNNGR